MLSTSYLPPDPPSRSSASWRLAGRTLRSGALVAVVAVGLSVPVNTQPARATAESFYAVPSPLPAGHPGDVIKHETMTANLAGPVPILDATATRIMYRSTDRSDNPVAVTGTVLVPTTPWTGPGERPLIAFAFGTKGLDDSCAPSRQLEAGTNVEGTILQLLISQGWAVAATDYLGVGTTNYPPSYIHRIDQARAILDAARAAQRLRLPGLPADGPVATWGYSQGGEGSGAALELQPTYAPDLNVFAGYAGSIPDDLGAVAKKVDGQYSSHLMGYFMNGFNNVYPAAGLTEELTPAGLQFMDSTSRLCSTQAAVENLMTDSTTLFKDGRTLDQHFADKKWKAARAALLLGTRAAPKVPVLVGSSTEDDIVPYPETRNVALRWCARATNVHFETTPTPNHIAAAVPLSEAAVAWMNDRIAGESAVPDCGHF